MMTYEVVRTENMIMGHVQTVCGCVGMVNAITKPTMKMRCGEMMNI